MKAQKNKKIKYDKVQKRNTYPEMKESKDRVKTFVTMLQTNPELLNYFTKKNVFTRTPELINMIVMTENFGRKEHSRSALFPLVEKFKGDKDFKHTSAEREVKKLIQDSIAFIKDENSPEYASVLKVLENVSEKEIDASKIFRNKEWYRGIIKTLGAAGLGAALTLGGLSYAPDVKIEEPEKIVEYVNVEDEECKKSLELCLSSLELNAPKVIQKACPPVNVDDVCKLYATEVNELKTLLAEGDKNLLAKLNALEEELKKEKDNSADLEKRFNAFVKELKLELLKKLDEKFSITDKEGLNSFYGRYRNIWANRLEDNEKAAFVTLIRLGDYLMVPDIKNGIVQGLYGHGMKMPNGTIADIREANRYGTSVYIKGNGTITDRKGTAAAFMNVVEDIYKYYKSIYGKKKWDGTLE